MRLRAYIVAAAVLSAGLAHATTITFSGAPGGAGFTGPVTESGYTYSLSSGNLFINKDGNPGNDVEPELGSGTDGVLEIVSATSTPFDFDGIDVASSGPGSITVAGYNGSTLVGSDSFAGANTGLPGTFDTYTSDNLTDLTVLYITLPETPETAIDNVVLNTAASPTPEPSSFILLGTGLLGVAGALKRRVA